jgi:uncharacterized protein YbjT (DUF2867 family)
VARILVTGATGYLGGRLVPLLLEDGHAVRCLVRDAARLAAKPWRDRVEVVEGDALDPPSLQGAFDGCDVGYYLIHAMGASERGFEDRDRRAAAAVAAEAARAGVRHLVYLGGLGDPEAGMSRHLASRQEVGRVLAGGGVPVTEFRAAIVVGSGSLSFEMIRYLTERLPVMVTPRWVDTRVQPIAVDDVLAYLRRAPDHPPEGHHVVEVGGPEVLTYRRLMEGYAEARGLRRRMIPTPVLSPRLSSYWINLVTPIPASIARPLVDGLASEVVVNDPEPARRYGVRPMRYRTAVKLALDRTAQGAPLTLWSDAVSAVPRGTPPSDKFVDQEGMLLDRRVRHVEADPDACYRAIVRLGGEHGWRVFDWLWQARGLLDRLIGGVGMRRGRRDPTELLPGDALDFWRVEDVDPGRLLQLRAEMKLPGRAWLRFDLVPQEDGTTELRQTAFFEPRGLLGFLYWGAVAPFHALVFPAMLRDLARRAEEAGDPPAGGRPGEAGASPSG